MKFLDKRELLKMWYFYKTKITIELKHGIKQINFAKKLYLVNHFLCRLNIYMFSMNFHIFCLVILIASFELSTAKVTMTFIVISFIFSSVNINKNKLNIYFQPFEADDDLVVTLLKPKSKLRGHVLKSYLGKDYYGFQDIPYAVPPVKKLRFQVSW